MVIERQTERRKPLFLHENLFSTFLFKDVEQNLSVKTPHTTLKPHFHINDQNSATEIQIVKPCFYTNNFKLHFFISPPTTQKPMPIGDTEAAK